MVSVITPSYKSERFIAKTIESVLAQTYKNWEMIIVDDTSPDNSNDIIEKYCNRDNRIKLVKLEKNCGPAKARNVAIGKAKGNYIAFLDSDDIWLPHKLEKQIKFMKDKKVALSYSSYFLINDEGKDLGLFKTKLEVTYNELLKTNCIGCLTAIYDVNKLGKVYMPDILKRQDYGLWLKILKKVPSANGIIEPLSIYRIRNNSVSSNKYIALKYVWKMYREFEKLNLFKSSYYFCCYIYNGLKKYK